MSVDACLTDLGHRDDPDIHPSFVELYNYYQFIGYQPCFRGVPRGDHLRFFSKESLCELRGILE